MPIYHAAGPQGETFMDELFEISIPNSANLQLADPSLLNFYNDLEERIYWLTGSIDNLTLDLVQYIIKWNREDKGIPIEERKPIRLIIFSDGGLIDVEESIVSFIRLSKTPVYGIAVGMVASAASLIYISCHKRYALPNAYLVIHKGSCGSPRTNYNELMAAMDDYKKQVEKMIDFYIKNTQIPEEVIRSKIESDWYVRGDELIDYGLVDEWIEDLEILL